MISRIDSRCRATRCIAGLFLALAMIASASWAADREDRGVALALDALEESVRALIESEDRRERAWGAYYVAEHGLRDLADDLHPLLLPRSAERSAELVTCAAFDALIRLESPIPPAILQNLPRQFCHEAIVASLHDPIPLAAELVALVSDADAPFVCKKAVGILLRDARTPGYAAMLLEEMVFRVQVCVVSEGRQMACEHLDKDLPAYETRRVVDDLSVPAGYPPIRRYRLRDTSEVGARVVRPGVWLQEISVTPGESESYAWSRGIEGDPTERASILSSWFVDSTSAFLDGYSVGEFHHVAWKGEGRLRTDVERLRAAQEQGVRDFAASLRSAGLLTKAEFLAVTPKIVVRVHDARTREDARQPLPRLRFMDNLQTDPSPDVTIGSVAWYRDYDTAREVAQRRAKPMWLHFGEHPG